MFDEFERYAVYWVPKRPDSLARFGASWTGWCAERGEFRPRGAATGLAVDLAGEPQNIWRHGFHGVIRAPFRLRPGQSRFAIETAMESLAHECVGFPLPTLQLSVLDGQVALVPHETSVALAALLSRTSVAFGRMAAEAIVPAPVATARSGQIVQLPAATAHRFHAPLTDPLAVDAAFEVMERLRPALEPILGEPRQLDEIALMGDPGEGRPLRVLQSYELRQTPPRRATIALPCQGPQMLAPLFDQTMIERDVAI